MNQVFAIAVGGAVGAVMRFWVSTWTYRVLGQGFPWGTLAVNVSGSLAMGFVYVLLVERLSLGPEWRAALMIGFLGAFTTFSTFSVEALNLVQAGTVVRALLYVLASVIFCVLAAYLGMIAGRQL
ncbi:MAG TPA: fluoride efflux transporter CrcB [Gammaproteobacteria bacterium]|nr:fluoride efflux transporter CrcB [Gammaproteobacteria bacterium]